MTNRSSNGIPSVLFVCTGNAGRRQMAQALFRERMGDRVRILSAGVDPWDHLHPMAMKLMFERGVSLAGHHPKSVSALADQNVDLQAGPRFPIATQPETWIGNEPPTFSCGQMPMVPPALAEQAVQQANAAGEMGAIVAVDRVDTVAHAHHTLVVDEMQRNNAV